MVHISKYKTIMNICSVYSVIAGFYKHKAFTMYVNIKHQEKYLAMQYAEMKNLFFNYEMNIYEVNIAICNLRQLHLLYRNSMYRFWEIP